MWQPETPETATEVFRLVSLLPALSLPRLAIAATLRVLDPVAPPFLTPIIVTHHLFATLWYRCQHTHSNIMACYLHVLRTILVMIIYHHYNYLQYSPEQVPSP